MEKVLTKKNVAEKFSVPQNTLTYWVKHKEDIISKYEPGQFGANRQKLSVGKHDSVDKAVYKWFMNALE